MKILVVNPGSTSTKIAIFSDDSILFDSNVKHAKEELDACKDIMAELPIRLASIEKALTEHGTPIEGFDAFAGRGGPLKPLKAGIYKVDDVMVSDIRNGNYQTPHSSLLGAVIVDAFSKRTGKPAFIVDPISTDEMLPVARVTGHPKIQYQALTHALNVRACARECAKAIGKKFSEVNFVVAHLGGGISINAVEKGKIIDVLEGRQTGPFSPTSSGALPVKLVVKCIEKGEITMKEIPDLFSRSGGLTAHFGTDDVKELLKKSESDGQILLVLQAMCFQIAKGINAMKTILKGEYERIILTGGLSHSETLVSWIKGWFPQSEKFHLIPGEFEMEALAKGALRALRGEEPVLPY